MSDLLLIQNALREATRPRRLLIALLLICLPAALGLAWRLLSPAASYVAGDVYDTLAVALIFSFTLPLLSVIYGTGVVSQEIEGRTIIYLLTRPHPRWRILLAKWLVALVVVAVTTILATVLLALVTFGTDLADAGLDTDIYALLMGALAYGALFLLLGTAVPRPLTYGLLWVFGWETLVAVLPGQFARVSIGAYLRALAARDAMDNAAADNQQNFLLSLARGAQVEIPRPEAWWVLSAVTLVCLVAALVIFSRREYSPREDAE